VESDSPHAGAKRTAVRADIDVCLIELDMVVVMHRISSHFLPGWRAVGLRTRPGQGKTAGQLCAKGPRSLIGSKRGSRRTLRLAGQGSRVPAPDVETAARMAAVIGLPRRASVQDGAASRTPASA